MLDFFRKYQRFFFLIVTVVIVISFSFFGTYSTLETPMVTEKVVATSIDGSQVYRNELEEMAMFLGSDSNDKLLFGGVWGPNFLNPGVIRNDFLTTGLAEVVISAYEMELIPDLQSRLEREKRYTPYKNPNSKLISSMNAWNFFAPEIKDKFLQLQEQQDAASSQGISSRVELYLAEQKFPSPILRQFLKYQESQYPWIPADPNLDSTDLSLFGYHTLEDWFGPKFIRLIAQVIINSAKIAEQRGYQVSRDEALASLLRNAQVSFEQNQQSPFLKATNSQQYFREQLRLMGMDQNKAVDLWRQVLLFERLFHDLGNAVIVDALPFKQFGEFSQEYAKGKIYQLPPELRLADFRSLQKLEVYLDAVAKKKNDSLLLPQEFLSLADISKSYPELVQIKYTIDVASINKKDLQAKVSLKETWQWETDAQHWELLKKQFPELGLKSDKTKEERFTALESLDEKTRSRLDAFARAQIVDEHPEWLEKALAEAPLKKIDFGYSKKGKLSPFEGVTDNEALKKALERSYESKQPEIFTFDQQNYYKALVSSKEGKEQVLTFAQAAGAGILDQILDKKLKDHYKVLREREPEKYQNPDKSFKEFKDVSSAIAEDYFSNTLKAVQSAAPQKNLTVDASVPYRLYPQMTFILDQIKRDPSKENLWVKEDTNHLADQWKLERKDTILKRHQNDSSNIDKELVFHLQPKQWTPIHPSPNGDLTFFQLEEKGINLDEEMIAENVFESQKVISYEAQRLLMRNLLQLFKEKNAISFDYLKRNE